MRERGTRSKPSSTALLRAVVGPVVVAAAAWSCKRAEPPVADAEPPLTSKIAAFTPTRVSALSPTATLGRLLFFETRASGDGTMSCATCHDPAKGFAD